MRSPAGFPAGLFIGPADARPSTRPVDIAAWADHIRRGASPDSLADRPRNIRDGSALASAGRFPSPSVLTQPGNSPGRVCDGLDQGYLHSLRGFRPLSRAVVIRTPLVAIYAEKICGSRELAYG